MTTAGRAGGRWVPAWTAATQRTEPDNLPPAPARRGDTVLADTTLRQTLRVSLGGPRLRLRLSNVFGVAPLEVTAAAVALPAEGRAGARAIAEGTSRPVRFAAATGARVPVGAECLSDPVELPVAAGTSLTVTLYLAAGVPAGGVTGHPGSRTTSYVAGGDRAREVDLPAAVPVEHWYLMAGLEVWAGLDVGVAVALGDSLTDGRGSTTDGNDRWPDVLADRLRAGESRGGSRRRVAVVNQGVGGNRVLTDGLGPHALSRLERDVLGVAGAAWLVLFEGVNDIGTAAADPDAQRRVAADLVDGYRQIARRCHASGIRAYAATITPFGGNDGYDDPAGLRLATRRAVNDWIRAGGGSGDAAFDAVLDFDAAVRDPDHPDRLRPGYDCGDRLHLNPAGYHALAAAVPDGLFD